MGKKISFNCLSVSDTKKAIAEMEQYKKDLERKTRELVIALTEIGEDVAKVTVRQLGVFDSGNLESSIKGYYSQSLGVGIIKTDCYYAIFCEFGTGQKGAQASHPMASAMGYQYDVNNHGDDGWFYYNQETGKSGWTTGMPSRPFMYETSVFLRTEVEKLAKKYLRS